MKYPLVGSLMLLFCSGPVLQRIFFRHAPPTTQDEVLEPSSPGSALSSELLCADPDSVQPDVGDRYRKNSVSSHGTHHSGHNDHAFRPVRNLAIMHYQKRSIFSSPQLTSEGSVGSCTERSFNHGSGCRWPCCMDYPWKGHERICLMVVFVSILLIIAGGIPGIYFAFRSSNSISLGPEIQQSPRIGIRVTAPDGYDGSGSVANDLVIPRTFDPHQKDDFGLHNFDHNVNAQELDCNELYTFRCGHNQCLPIPLWCDGRTDCTDKKDEHAECALTCPPRFFACLNHSSVRLDKTHDWCIPETLVCNGLADCEDLSDEYFCKCSAEQIRCSDGICKNRTDICRGADTCISDTAEPLHCNCLDDLPQHKFCDGFPDCDGNLDEIECSTSCDTNDQFSCWRSGYGCVHKTSVCDGIRDCANGEDEDECLRLLADGESMPDNTDYVGSSRPAGIILVRRWGVEFSPVCLKSDIDLQADSYVGTLLCQHFGYTRLIYAEALTLPRTSPSSNRKFYSFNPQTTVGDPSRHFIPVKQCASSSVLRIHCTEMMCEPRLHRKKGVVVTETGELVLKRQEQFFPFIVQIYKRVWSSWVLRCGGVIIHPLWLITSSSCIDQNGYFKVLAGPYWQSSNPKLMQSRDISLIVQGPETPATNGKSEIVLARLDNRLECHDFLGPLCLPDSGYQLISTANSTSQFANCVTLGWNITANRASSMPYPSELYSVREIEIVPTEECSRSLWNRTPEPLDNLICVRISSRDSANLLSDPGGVLVCSSGKDTSKWELMGVLSGYKARVTGNYVRVFALYSRLDQHLKWLMKEFAGSDVSSP